MKFFSSLDALESDRVSKRFKEVLGFILDDKPEYIINPYFYALGKKRKNIVSDYIDSINNKILGENNEDDSLIVEDTSFKQLEFEF